MNKAPEVNIADALNANATLTAAVGKFYPNQWPRNVRLPVVTVQHVGDSNTKRTLSKYGGEMLLQFDIYNKQDTPNLRETLKAALRALRGAVGELSNVNVVISNELNQGVDETGAWRWTVDATVFWED